MQYPLNLQIQTFGFCFVRQACSQKICSQVTIKQWWPSLRTSNNVQPCHVWLILVTSEQNMNMIEQPQKHDKSNHWDLLFSLETQQLPGPGKSKSPKGCSIRLRLPDAVRPLLANFSKQTCSKLWFHEMVPWTIPGEPNLRPTWHNLSLFATLFTSLSSTSTQGTNNITAWCKSATPLKQYVEGIRRA